MPECVPVAVFPTGCRFEPLPQTVVESIAPWVPESRSLSSFPKVGGGTGNFIVEALIYADGNYQLLLVGTIRSWFARPQHHVPNLDKQVVNLESPDARSV